MVNNFVFLARKCLGDPTQINQTPNGSSPVLKWYYIKALNSCKQFNLHGRLTEVCFNNYDSQEACESACCSLVSESIITNSILALQLFLFYYRFYYSQIK